MRDILNIANHQDLSKAGFDRASLRKIFVEYDSSEDKFSLRLSATNELTPEEASTVVSLLTEGQRIRAEYFKKLNA